MARAVPSLYILGAAKLYVVYMRPAWMISYSLTLAPSSGEGVASRPCLLVT